MFQSTLYPVVKHACQLFIAISLTTIWLLAVPGCNSKPTVNTAADLLDEEVEPVIEVPTVPEQSPATVPEPYKPKAVPQSDSGFEFVTIGPASGLDFTRYDDIRGQRRIIESTGGGVAMIDLDADGWLDLFFTGGCRVPEELASTTATCGLFRNTGLATFANITAPSMLLMPGYCQGCAVGDIDGDGFEDLYVTALGRNGLWRSNGDGTFENITESSGVQDLAWSTSCAFADLNLDGHLDLYVANYLDESPEQPLLCPNENSPDGYEQCPPSKYEGVDDRLFLSNGEGGFLDATELAGIAGRKGKGLGVVISDLNGDGSPEIYVANDGQANFLFTPTQGASRAEQPISIPIVSFEERALTSGCALSGSGYAQASMGIAAADYDQNGSTDLLLTHFIRDSNTLYLNQGDLQFSDHTRTSGLLGPSKGVLGWGVVFQDFDGDGLLDLFVANGHVEDRRWMQQGEPYQMLPQAFRNLGSGRFKEVLGAGSYFEKAWLGRGVATGDLDGDRVPDLAVSHQLEPSVALLNRTPQKFSPIEIRLVGVESNRSAINVKIVVKEREDGEYYYREIVGGGSFLSASSRSIHLALNSGSEYKVEVQWPSGRRTLHQISRESIASSKRSVLLLER